MNKATKLIITIIPVVAVLLFAALVPFVAADQAPTMDAAVLTIDAPEPNFASGNGVQTLTNDTSSATPAGGIVDTAGKLLAMLNDTTTQNTYYLRADFVITASLWTKVNNFTAERKFNVDGLDGDVIHSITYSPDQDVKSGSLYGGLFARYSGTMSNVKYVFSSKLEACAYDINNDSGSTLYYGGLAGIFSGTLDNCTVISQGSVFVYANRDSCTIYAGGVAGIMQGATISNSTVTVSGSITASSLYETDDEEIKRSTLSNYNYAGGLAARTEKAGSDQTKVTNSKVTISGTIYAHDNASKKSGIQGWFQSANGDGYIFPAGGLVATTGSLVLESNDITMRAKINSTGGEYSSKVGAISGGLVAYSDSSSYMSVSANVFNMSGTIMASHERKDASVYKGGFVGRFEGLNTAGKLRKNAINYSMKVTKTALNGSGTDYYGYLCGNGGSNFRTWNDNSNWMVITGTEYVDEVSDIVKVRCTPSSTDCGSIGTLVVYGGGTVSAKISNNTITFYANQLYSPFYNWFSNISGNEPIVHTDGINTAEAIDIEGNPYTQYTFTPSTASNGLTVYSVFLTREISTAGQLVQWTAEMNGGLNRPWVKAVLTNDIIIEQGVYMVNDFYGEFDGQGHTLTFNTGVTMNGDGNLRIPTDPADATTYLYDQDEAKLIYDVTRSKDTKDNKYSCSGIFRTARAGSKIHNFKLTFAGTMLAGAAMTGKADADKKSMSILSTVGTLVGKNYGTVYDIEFYMPMAGNLAASATDKAYAGALIGMDLGSVYNINAVIEGKVKAAASTCYSSGLVGVSLKTTDVTYSKINLDIKGQINAFIQSDAAGTGNAYASGLVGLMSSKLNLSYVILNVRDTSNVDGDVLVATCKHNTDYYQDFLELARKFVAGSSSASEDIDEMYELVFAEGDSSVMRSATTTRMIFEQLKANVNTAYNNKPMVTDEWFERNILKLIEQVDCNAPCSDCEAHCLDSIFCARMSNNAFELNQVWVIGSYAQYAGQGTHDAGVSVLPYFDGTIENIDTVTGYYLNLIYVQSGTATCDIGGFYTKKDDPTIYCDIGSRLQFSVPIEDSSRVFTGWFTTYDLNQMADEQYINGDLFVPGTQSGSVWYSRVINSMIISSSELNLLATTTNAGQRYNGITFTLGSNIIVNDNFTPIGTVANCFDGTLDGRGYAIILNNGFVSTYNTVGVFGCLGQNGLVKQMTIKLNSIGSGNLSGKIVGVVAAINDGTVGQNAQSDVKIYINCAIPSAAITGGAVGVNRNTGVVQNTEVYFDKTSGSMFTGASTLSYADQASVAGGVVAYNEGTVKNVQVTAYRDETIDATATKAYAGGVVGYNKAQVYSSVINIYADSKDDQIVPLTGNNKAIIIGNNQSINVDSLWAVYCLSTSTGFVVPETQTLINGTNQEIGNRLIRYGYGDISTEILASTQQQLMGGSILFSAIEDEVKKVPFYEFTRSLDRGETVDGAAGTNYRPVVGSAVAGESGKTYYAVFANSEIKNENDFYDFIAHVNGGFRAYVDYIVNLTGGTVVGLDADDVRYQSIGNGNNVFVGTFDANNYDIEVTTIAQEKSIVPLFGTIGATSQIRNINLKYSEKVNFRTGYRYKIGDEYQYLGGAVAYVNLGRIYNLTLTFLSGVYGSDDGYGTQKYANYVGVVAGYNNGTITNCKIACSTGKTPSGQNVAGSVYGEYTGGVVGINDVNGVIGSDDIASISVVLSTGDGRTSSVVGLKMAGGAVGLNLGRVANVSVTLGGYIGAPVTQDDKVVMGYKSDYTPYAIALAGSAPACSVGGIAAENRGNIYGVKTTASDSATIASAGGYVGGIVATNDTNAAIGETSSATVMWHAALTNAAAFGGIAADNKGSLANLAVAINIEDEKNMPTLIIETSQYLGGIVGLNSGSIHTASVDVGDNVYMGSSAGGDSYVGGLIGYNEGSVQRPAITIRGYLGSDRTDYVGGFAGYTSGIISNGYVINYHDLAGRPTASKGVAVGATAQKVIDDEPVEYGSNAWAVAYNSVRLTASASSHSGFNVLKIVAAEMVTASISASVNMPRISFTTNLDGVNWYADISALTFIYNNDTSRVTGKVYTPAYDLKDCYYHLCSYDLLVDGLTDLSKLYTYINSADLFYGVTFRVTGNIEVTEGTMLQPIGTFEHPFTGIFDGNNKTITFRAGSGIVGSEYSGLFGYVADCATLRNFILQFDPDVLIGSTCDYVGALAGRIDGQVRNVAINMQSAPYSKTVGAKVGALAGAVGDDALFENVWISIYNSGVDAVVGMGNVDDISRYNVLHVYGRGALRFTVNTDTHAFTFTVNQAPEYFDAWYSDFGAGKEGVFAGDTYGTFTGADMPTIAYTPKTALHAKVFTASFISLVIKNAEEFYQFAKNINDYGVVGARFTLSLGERVKELVLDLSQMEPVGNSTHPFQATFDGSITEYGGMDTGAYTIILRNAVQDADYSGLFGLIGPGAVIRNLVVKADTQVAQTLGSRTSIYTGFFAGAIAGDLGNPVTLESVVVALGANTTLVNSHSDAIGAIAGLWGRYVNPVNTWAILPELGDYGLIGAYRTADSLVTYQEGTQTVTLPSTMYLAGDGDISYKHIFVDPDSTDFTCMVSFSLTSTDANPFGFIERYDPVEKSKSDVSTTFLTTVDGSTALADWHDKVYIGLYLKTEIESAADLQALADLVEMGRNYTNVVYRLSPKDENNVPTDIINLIDGLWRPIGGSIETAAGSQEYKQVPFRGILDGQGYTISMPEKLYIEAEYAGLFGILAPSAIVRNLRITTASHIGNSVDSQYAGVLAAIDQGATLQNIIIEIATAAVLDAKLSTGRVAVNQAIEVDADNQVVNYNSVAKATNVWVLGYNSHYTVDQNEAEAAFNYGIPTNPSAWATPFAAQGSYNGGVNVLTLIANGSVRMEFSKTGNTITGVVIKESGGDNGVKEWYYFDADGNKVDCSAQYGRDGNNDRVLSASLSNQIVYASFVNETITTLADLINLGKDVAAGCDLYDITFVLANDLVISNQTLAAAGENYYSPLGTLDMPFNAIFDGQGHTITLAQDVTISGVVSGIFGVTGEDAVLCNLKLDLCGTLGNGNSLYVGAVAYNRGRLQSVIIDATAVTLVSVEGGYAGAAFGWDISNLHTNTWLIVKGSDTFDAVGEVFNGTTATINIMKVIGMGKLTTQFVTATVEGELKYYVKMFNEGVGQAVMGWYSGFARDNQLSTASNITPAAYPDITAGDTGTFVASDSIFSCRYEVVIISTVLTNQEELIKLASDVNIGGYTFANTTFTLGGNITVSSMEFASIGTTETPFAGTFRGSDSSTGSYYAIYMQRRDSQNRGQGLPLFGTMSGTVENLVVKLAVDLQLPDKEAGVIAAINHGTIANCMVMLWPLEDSASDTITLGGRIVGGIAGINTGVVQNCLTIISAKSTIQATATAGGLVGQNEGSVVGSIGGSEGTELSNWQENQGALALRLDSANPVWASVVLYGSVKVVNNSETSDLYAGGAIGESRSVASINRVSVVVMPGALITGQGEALELGGLAGKSLSPISNSTVIFEGGVYAYGADPVDEKGNHLYTTPKLTKSYMGTFVGNIQGSVGNSWLVVRVGEQNERAVGNGFPVNVLQINGKGDIATYIDRNDNILFYNTTTTDGASIDGWYLNSGISASLIGGIDSDSFAPNSTVMGYTVTVVFISTSITDLNELLSMASTVNAGLFATDLEFELKVDLTLYIQDGIVYDKDPTKNNDAVEVGKYASIGTAKNPFKHIFKGNGHTITLVQVDSTPLAWANMGMFGYTGTGAKISNLNVVLYKGIYGAAGTTTAIGGLVGVNYGTITGCSVQLGAAATDSSPAVIPTLTGVKVGGLAGENFGSIADCVVATYAVLRADTGADDLAGNEYAGGVVGANSGTVSNIDLTLGGEIAGRHTRYSDNTISDKYTGTAYVGGVCGNNTMALSYVRISTASSLSIISNSSVLAYAGGVCGNNTGSIAGVYMQWNALANISSDNTAGVIVGVNNNHLANILLVYDADCMPITNVDAAIGNSGTFGKADNVWVFNYSDILNSKDKQINNMTSGTAAVVHSDADEVLGGTIRFYAAVDSSRGFTVYANASDDYRTVLLDDFVAYDSTTGKLGLNLYHSESAYFVPTASRTSISVRAEVRRTVGDQSELKAMAKSLADPYGQAIKGEYSLTADIDVSGTYLSIGTTRSFEADLAGNMHTVRFGADTIFDAAGYQAMFGSITGKVSQLIIRHEAAADNLTGVVWNNNGALDKVVVYATQGVKLKNATYNTSTSTPNVTNNDLWIISRESVSNDTITNPYHTVIVAGPGSLNVSLVNNILMFDAVCDSIAQGETYVNTFAGWSDGSNMFDAAEQTERFNTQAMAMAHSGSRFRADFISTNIASALDLTNLINLLRMHYTGIQKQESGAEATSYYFTSDITIDSNVLATANLADFGGVFVGNMHTLTLENDVDRPFGNFSSVLRDFVIDARAIRGEGATPYHLFGDGATATLSNVVIYTSGRTGYLQNIGVRKLACNNVYLAMDNDTWQTNSAGIDIDRYIDLQQVGVVVSQMGDLSFEMQNGALILSAQAYVEGYYFAGWRDLVADTTYTNASVSLTGNAKYAYRSTYVKEHLATEADLRALAEAVAGGRTFTDCTFTLAGNLSYAAKGLTIGNANYAFEGVLDGQDHTLTATGNGNAPLFDRLVGSVRNMVFATTSGGIANAIAGTMQNVVVASTAQQAVFAGSITGTVDSGWLVVQSGTVPTVSHGIKTVVMQNDVAARAVVEVTGISVNEGVMHITFRSKYSDKFMVWRNLDGTVKDVSNYDFISSDVDTDDFYSVEATNQITNASEYVYFAKATSEHFENVAYLASDIVLDGETLQPLHYVYNLNGKNHTITVQSSSTLCWVNSSSTGNSSINNVKLHIVDSVVSFGLCRQTDGHGSCSLNNVVVISHGNTTVDWSNCTYNNTWWAHNAAAIRPEQMTMDAGYAALPNGVNVLRYSRGAIDFDIEEEVDQGVTTTRMKASVLDEVDSTGLYFLGCYYDGANHAQSLIELASDSEHNRKRYQALFALQKIATSADWTHNAMVTSIADNTDFDFELVNDIDAAADFAPILYFDGTLEGNFHAIRLQGGSENAGQVVQVRNGTVQHVAIEVYHNYVYDGSATLFEHVGDGSGSCADCWIINDTSSAIKHAADVRMMTISDEIDVDKAQKDGTGIIIAQSNGAFAFDSKDKTEYRLHLYVMGGDEYDKNDSEDCAIVFAANETRDIVAQFNSCYTITVAVDGISQALVKSVNGNDAFLSSTKFVWSTENNYTVQYKDTQMVRLIDGYLFVGFSADSDSPAISKHSLTAWDVDTGLLRESITITAHFVQITSEWNEIVFGDLTPQQIDEYLVLSDAVGEAINSLNTLCGDMSWGGNTTSERYVTVDGDVKGLVENLPYHAGGYIINFYIKYQVNDETMYLGASDGLSFRVAKRTLNFESIEVSANRKYDGSAVVQVVSMALSGFSANPNDEARLKTQVSTAGVSFVYFDAANGDATANAGLWNIKVADGSTLASKTLNSTVLFDSDYALPAGAVYLYTSRIVDEKLVFTRAEQPFEASINKQDLDMVVRDISMDYLAQFGSIQNGVYVPLDIRSYFEDGIEITTNFINEQEAADIRSKATKLLRIEGDRTVVDEDGNVDYTYYLRSVGTYYIEVVSDALDNYIPRISGRKATLTVLPSAISVGLAVDDNGPVNTAQYGDVPTNLVYHAYYGDTLLSDLAEALATSTGVYGNTNAANWFAVTLEPIAAYSFVNGLSAFNTIDVGISGMQYSFAASNTNFTLDIENTMNGPGVFQVEDSVDSDNNKVYHIIQTNSLLVVEREITYQVTSSNTKVFAAEDTLITGRVVGKALASGDKLVFVRATGEYAGDYAIFATVQDANGKDVSTRYKLTGKGEDQVFVCKQDSSESAFNKAKNGQHYYYVYTITKRTIVVARTGNGRFYYGSDEIADMPYSLSISAKVKNTIEDIVDAKRNSFDNEVRIRIGSNNINDADNAYSDVKMTVNYASRYKTDEIKASMDFVLDEKSKSYYVVRAPLTVSLVDFARDYDTTEPNSVLKPLQTEMTLQVQGWVGSDEYYYQVKVGRYESDKLSASAGNYFITPAALTIVDSNGNEATNYAIGNVYGGTYTIRSIRILVEASVGTYDDFGNYTSVDSVMFGDSSVVWSFDVDPETLPDYLQLGYDAEASRKQRTQWLIDNLSIVAAAPGSLAVGTRGSASQGSQMGEEEITYYVPYSSNPNIALDVSDDLDFTVLGVRIEVSDIEVTAPDAKSRPVVSFTLKAYSVNVDGTKDKDITDSYLDTTTYSHIAEGDRIVLNDGLSIVVSYASYNVENCTMSFTPYVKDADNWYQYDQYTNDSVLYCATTDESGNVSYVKSTEVNQIVSVNPGVWQSLFASLKENMAMVIFGTLGGAIVIATLAIGATLLYRRKRLRMAVQRTLRNEAIFDRIGWDGPSGEADSTQTEAPAEDSESQSDLAQPSDLDQAE